MKKSQVTIFIILGILIVASIAISNKIKEDKIASEISDQADTVVKEILQTNIINDYVTKCLDTTTENAIYLIEHQGGIIYPNQDGSLLESNPRFIYFSIGNDYSANISYAISVDKSYQGVSPPKYPCGKTGQPPYYCAYINNLSKFSQGLIDVSKIRFGADTLNPLCKTARDCLFKYGTKAGPFSIQKQMENFIEGNIGKCLNFSSFLVRLNHNVTVEGEPNVSIQLKPSSIEVTMKYPLKISFQNQEPITKIVDFKTMKSSRLMSMYVVAYDIVRKEITNLSFTPLMQYMRPIDKHPYQFTHLKDYYMKDDIFRIINYDNFIHGEAEVFQFAIENRNPSLDYIPGTLPPGKEYDIIIMEGNSMILEPKGYDPDNDNLTYVYKGWMADYNLTYINSYGKYDYPNVYSKGSSITIGNLRNLLKSTSDFEMDFTKSRSMELKLSSNLWETSQFFLETKRKADYLLTKKDIGPHNVSIFIFDKGNLVDYQVVRILIDDEIDADASKARSIFDEINSYYPGEYFTSIEDPFILDAKGTIDHVKSASVIYEWSDINELPALLVETSNDSVYFPCKPENLNILDMSKPEIRFSNGPKDGEKFNLHFLKLTAKSEGMSKLTSASEDVVSLRVFECIPHRNNNALSYPYNGIVNPFYADHTCCEGGMEDMISNPLWGSIKDSTNVCYSAKLQIPASGELITVDLIKKSYCGSNPENCEIDIDMDSITEANAKITEYRTSKSNDILELTVKRYCDGNRGNTCTGKLEIVSPSIKSCKDVISLNTQSWQVENCEGAENNYGKAECSEYYPGNSFEKSKGYNKLDSSGIADGFCSNKLRCSDSVDDDVQLKDSGKYLVNPQCNSGKCGYVSTANSFDCSSLNGKDILDTDNDGFVKTSISQSTSGAIKIERDENNRWYSYTYSCNTKNNVVGCNKTKTYDLNILSENLNELIGGPESNRLKILEDKNLAYISRTISQYADSGSVSNWGTPSGGICGDDENEYVRRFCKNGDNCKIFDFSSRIASIPTTIVSSIFDINSFSHGLNSDYPSAEISSSSIGCCNSNSDCFYGGTCYKSVSGNTWSSLFPSIQGQNKFGIRYGETGNKYMICKNAHWFVFVKN